MDIIRKTTTRIGLGFVVTLLSFTPVYPADQKIDPALAIMMLPKANLETAKAKGIIKALHAGEQNYVRTILKFKGDLSGVEQLGGRISSIIGELATVDLPLNAVKEVSTLPNIIYIETAKRLSPRLDVSVPVTGAPTLRSGTPPNWSGLTGKNVIIGIVDSGIDLGHRDFRDSSNKTRVLSLWDQTMSGTPPQGFSYGTECTKAAIDGGQCAETDADGHGTHIAGIAAGNGSATGRGKPAFRYVGMAPEADLIIVNTNFNTGSILDGISFIERKAQAFGEPVVINLSLGSDLGPHDGTSLYEQALDNAFSGSVIVAAAGNEATANIHASGTVLSGPATVSFTLPSNDTGEALDIWYPGADQMGIVFSSVDSGCTTSMVSPGDPIATFDTSCGTITISSSGVNPNNGDREIFVTLEPGAAGLAAGAWTFSVSGISVTNGRFDAWFEFSGDPATSAQFKTNIDPSITLDDTATATRPITVAAFNTKNSWHDFSNKIETYRVSVKIGDIADFSSHGPRRSCSDAAKCPPIQKPDIAAPGRAIMSSLSADAASSISTVFIDPDGVHFIDQGTSMAAPHVAGAVALLLQATPTLMPDDVKNILITHGTGSSDSFTGTLPNNTWGVGKLDIAFAAASLSTSAGSGGGGGGGGNHGCFIATAAYGSYLDSHVKILREFRDSILLKSEHGKKFVELYYAWSPGIADIIAESPSLRFLTRTALMPVVFAVEHPYPGLTGFIALLLVPAAIVLRYRHSRKQR